MRALRCLFLGALLLAVASANAFALINTSLVADDKVGYGSTFDAEVKVEGTDKVGAMTLKVVFAPTLVEVTAITAGAMGPVVPTDMAKVNTDGTFTIAYANVAGFTPDAAGSVVATITCKAGAAPGGSAPFTFDTSSNIKGATGFPPPDLTGTFTGKTVEIVDPATLNTCPTAEGAVLELDEDQKDVKGVLVGEDADGNALTYSIVEQSTIGTATITDDKGGAYTFEPVLNKNGDTSFTFKVNDGKCDSANATVVVKIKAIDDPPVAEDGELTTDEGKTGSGTLLATDVDNTTLKFSIATQGKLGAASVLNAETGEYQYVPNDADVNGTDEFTFKVESGTPALSDTGTIKVTINKVNDAPVAKDEDQKALAAVLSDAATLAGTLVYSDVDGDALTVTITAQPATGKIEVTDPKTGAYSYTPASPFPVALPATDSFKFKVSDGTLESAEATVNMTVESGAHKLTVKVSPTEGGKVTPTGEVVVEDGKSQDFKTAANERYFAYSARVLWADGTKTFTKIADNKFTVKEVKQDGTLTVNFKERYTITISATPEKGGVCDPMGPAILVNGGADQIITVTANKGFMIEEVKIDGVAATIADDTSKTFTHTFTAVAANHTVDVVFESTGEYHSGDIDMDNVVSMPELLRVIQLFNLNMGQYVCDGTTEDGYASGNDAAKRTCMQHSADSDDNWEFSLSELLRVIQFWSLGGYHKATPADEGFPTTDGFAPGK